MPVLRAVTVLINSYFCNISQSVSNVSVKKFTSYLSKYGGKKTALKYLFLNHCHFNQRRYKNLLHLFNTFLLSLVHFILDIRCEDNIRQKPQSPMNLPNILGFSLCHTNQLLKLLLESTDLKLYTNESIISDLYLICVQWFLNLNVILIFLSLIIKSQ